jgi:hypothetical protein
MGIKENSERIMLAITFAEAGEQEMAREFLSAGKVLRQRKRLSTRPRKELHVPSRRRG